MMQESTETLLGLLLMRKKIDPQKRQQIAAKNGFSDVVFLNEIEANFLMSLSQP